MFPRDDDFRRRAKDRPSGDAETVGPVRFFQTCAGPDATPYPTSGNVYYAQLLRDVVFTKVIPTAAPTFTATGEYDYLEDISGISPKSGDVVLATKIGARWFL